MYRYSKTKSESEQSEKNLKTQISVCVKTLNSHLFKNHHRKRLVWLNERSELLKFQMNVISLLTNVNIFFLYTKSFPSDFNIFIV